MCRCFLIIPHQTCVTGFVGSGGAVHGASGPFWMAAGGAVHGAGGPFWTGAEGAVHGAGEPTLITAFMLPRFHRWIIPNNIVAHRG